MPVSITTPLSRDQARTLRSGDSCLLSGVIYTARDAAHKRLCELAEQGKPLPIDMKDAVIYYVGPTPARPGEAIGPEVVEAMKAHGAVYFGAIGGCGALLSQCVKKAEVVAYEDLGAEAIRRLEVENFPVVVVIDSQGNNLYETGRSAYLESLNG